MISHGILTLYRTLTRHRLYALLNLFGLAAGIAVFLIAQLVVRYESGFNHWLPGVNQTYRLDSTFTDPGEPPFKNAEAPFVAYKFLKADFPGISAATRQLTRDSVVRVGDTLDSEPVSYVDPSFLNVIRLPLISGSRAEALATPSDVVIDQSTARKYFGSVRAVGRTLSIAYDGVAHNYTVSAVMRDVPPDSTFKARMLTLLRPDVEKDTQSFRNWGSMSGSIFLTIKSPAAARQIRAGLVSFVQRHASGTGANQLGPNAEQVLHLVLVPFTTAHFHDVDVESEVPGVDRRVVLSLAAVGLMALLTAAINYVNLATARAGLRAREVAVRKVVGASREALLWQFLGEAVALTAFAGLIGLSATELAVPLINALGGWAMPIDYLTIVPWLILIVLVVGLGAGAYPALMLANYRPASVLASSRTPAGGRMGTRLRNLLVLAQFISAIAFAICTLVIDAQASFLRNADRGFDRHGLIIVRSLLEKNLLPRQLDLLTRLSQVPGVVSATLSDREPASNNTENTGIRIPGRADDTPSVTIETVGRNYMKTYGIHLIAGRWFDASHGRDDLAGKDIGTSEQNAVINQAALRDFGVTDARAAIGKSFRLDDPGGNDQSELHIIGVVADVRFMSPRRPVSPQLYFYNSHAIAYGQGAIRYEGVSSAEMLSRLRTAWHTAAPDQPFQAKTADQRLVDFYKPEQQRAQLFSAGAVLAVAIACIGLYGLASFAAARRMLEIGIRKVLGASTRNVLVLLVGQFVRPVIIANLIAWPIAYAVMRSWLSGFNQRISLSPLYFLAAGAGALLIAVLTVLGQAWRVARAEPARALRYE